MKQDNGKARYDLIEWRAIDDMANIMAVGAAAHGDQGWKTLIDAEDRYFSAAMRHLVAWRGGDTIDGDSGYPHLAHVMCNIMFLSELDKMAAARATAEEMGYSKVDKMMSNWPDQQPKKMKKMSEPLVRFTLADGAGSD